MHEGQGLAVVGDRRVIDEKYPRHHIMSVQPGGRIEGERNRSMGDIRSALWLAVLSEDVQEFEMPLHCWIVEVLRKHVRGIVSP